MDHCPPAVEIDWKFYIYSDVPHTHTPAHTRTHAHTVVVLRVRHRVGSKLATLNRASFVLQGFNLKDLAMRLHHKLRGYPSWKVTTQSKHQITTLCAYVTIYVSKCLSLWPPATTAAPRASPSVRCTTNWKDLPWPNPSRMSLCPCPLF